jgi:hypothetical protein
VNVKNFQKLGAIPYSALYNKLIACIFYRKLEKKMPSTHQNLIKDIKRLDQDKKKLKETKMLIDKRDKLKEKAADGQSKPEDRKVCKYLC